uniref:Uncharacterized protein n=1 Tax=Takifugu rubripes TaxID=31033 RepID=A0A674N7U5_TAKRU
MYSLQHMGIHFIIRVILINASSLASSICTTAGKIDSQSFFFLVLQGLFVIGADKMLGVENFETIALNQHAHKETEGKLCNPLTQFRCVTTTENWSCSYNCAQLLLNRHERRLYYLADPGREVIHWLIRQPHNQTSIYRA